MKWNLESEMVFWDSCDILYVSARVRVRVKVFSMQVRLTAMVRIRVRVRVCGYAYNRGWYF